MYELVIIGGGPAGVTAGIYAARKKIRTALVTDTFGGQSLVSSDIQNWIGTISISGFELGKSLEKHLRAQEGIDIIDGDNVTEISDNTAQKIFTIKTKQGRTLETRFLLVTSGSRRRRLGVPGESELDGKGVAYCSICDAPLFRGKDVVVIGSGNSGLEAVRDLLPYAKNIFILDKVNGLRGDKTTQEKILKEKNVQTILGVDVLDIFGSPMVQGLHFKKGDGDPQALSVGGVFIEIGLMPNSDIVRNFVKLNEYGAIIVDAKTQRASNPRIWAAGDVSDGLYRQNNISVGDAVKAVLNIHDSLHSGVV
ncbi:MAG: FAD-dependent oxidoreductase [Candidatus Jorgensenbacteria bacterium]|nr:FAD-dependent oxidoreductase [Candidatus Jorgensenbacteria bacterium]